jgi:importin subunit alpha-2
LIINKFFLFISGGNVEQIALLCQFGAIAPLCTLLEAKEPKTILVVLDGLANILAAAEKMGELEKVSLHVEECGGLDRIEALQSHDNVEIYHKSLAILEQYFSTDVNYSFLLFLFLVLFQ